ncbi:MAG: heme exporter protein CcmD [Agarilytica sp.]
MAVDGRVHGPYVWAAYVITLGGIAAIALNVKFARKRFLKRQAALLRRNAPSA